MRGVKKKHFKISAITYPIRCRPAVSKVAYNVFFELSVNLIILFIFQCSRSCGGGYRNLTYYCVLDGRIHEDYACDPLTKPSDREKCNEQACSRWAPLNNYHSCSVTCGEGIERRIFVCKKFDSDTVLDDIFCRDLKIPTETRPCYKAKCDVSKNSCSLCSSFIFSYR